MWTVAPQADVPVGARRTVAVLLVPLDAYWGCSVSRVGEETALALSGAGCRVSRVGSLCTVLVVGAHREGVTTSL